MVLVSPGLGLTGFGLGILGLDLGPDLGLVGLDLGPELDVMLAFVSLIGRWT